MPESALARKLKLKPGARAVIVNAPEGYLKELGPLPTGVKVEDKLTSQFDWVQIFVRDKADLDQLLPRVVAALKPDSTLWISFPKGMSKIQTDFTRDKGWDALKKTDLKWVTLVAVNDTWSGFGLRPYKPGEARQKFR